MSRSSWTVVVSLDLVILLISACSLVTREATPRIGESTVGVSKVIQATPTAATVTLATPTPVPDLPLKDTAVSPTTTPIPPMSTVGPESSPIPTLPPGGPGTATDLQADVVCSETEPRKGIARLSWSLASPPGSEQRIAVTIFKGGFEKGNFEVTDLFPPDRTSFVLEQLHGQAIHYWKVLTRHPDGWVASETASFVGPVCVADFHSRQDP